MKQSTFHQRETDRAVSCERSFWQLVVVLAGLAGCLFGVAGSRVHAASVRSTPIKTSAVRVVQLETAAKLRKAHP